MRLIDAEKCPCIVCEDTRNAHCTYEHRSCEKFCNWLNNTAFDTEKVVEQLEEEGQKMAEAKPTKPYGKSSPSCHRYYKAISVKKAIDIVKKGGAE